MWPDLATIRQATGGRAERPLFEQDLADWVDRLQLETYDGIEIAPRLPAVSGPPIFVIDEDLRIVDITASAAATIGWPAEDLVGQVGREISLGGSRTAAANRGRRSSQRAVCPARASYLVPDTGAVFLRYHRRARTCRSPAATRCSSTAGTSRRRPQDDLAERWRKPFPPEVRRLRRRSQATSRRRIPSASPQSAS